MQNEVIEGYRLSPQQECLWLSRIKYGIPFRALCLVSIRGGLNPERLKASLQKLVERHEILRTSFRCLLGMTVPLQVIEAAAPSFEYVDLSELSPALRATEIKRVYAAEESALASAAEDDAVCFKLFYTSPGEHTLLISLPAMCADDAGLGNLVEEIVRCYAAGDGGGQPPEELVQYADISEWQNELLESADTEAGREYWRRQAHSDPGALKLPFQRASAERHAFRQLTSALDAEALERVEALARVRAVSLETVLLACWQVLLGQLSGRREVVVGVAAGGRVYDELKGALGLFTRFVPVRARMEGDRGFDEFLSEVETAAAGARQWQEYFSRELTSQQEGDGAFFPFTFSYVGPLAEGSGGGVTFSVREQQVYLERFAVNLNCFRRDGAWILRFEYDANSFDEEAVARLAEDFRTLLSSVSANPSTAVTLLNLVSADERQLPASDPPSVEEERRRLLLASNGPPANYPLHLCAHELFALQAQKTPSALAVTFGEQSMTYRELDEKSSRLARFLSEAGVGHESRVGIHLRRSPEVLVAILGVLKAGAAYVPLEARLPQQRLRYMLEDSGVERVLVESALLESLPLGGLDVVLMDGASNDPDWLAEFSSAGEQQARLTPESLAYVLYTSGSTGQPKGVLVEQRGLTNYLCHAASTYITDAVLGSVVSSPLGFDATLTTLLAPLLAGRRVELLPDDAETMYRLMERLFDSEEGLLFKLTPAHLEALRYVERTAQAGAAAHVVVVGGEQLGAALVARWKRELLPRATFVNEYGPTETVVGCTGWALSDGRALEGLEVRAAAPIGRPIGNTRVYVLDSQMRPAPEGVAGEIYIGGAGVARGYVNLPGLTAERFVPDPYVEGGRLYKTGDVGLWVPGGEMEYLGRNDAQVKIRGYRVEPGEVEAALARHPAVSCAVVVARGEGADRHLAAYVVCAPGVEPLDAREVREHAHRVLPEYMVPQSLTEVKELPLTPNGKIDRRALLELEPYAAGLANTYVAPRDLVELQLVQMWEELLGARAVGVTDNFFDLGGQSILAVRLLGRIQRQFQRELPMTTLLQAGTVEQLASLLRQQKQAEEWSPLVALQPNGSRRPFYFVHAAGGNVLSYVDLARHLGPEQPFYGLQSSGLDGLRRPFTRIEEMAAHYVEAILARQPEGPYLLGGWCMGTIIAFEMAQQLERLGQRAALLVLVDGGAPKVGRTNTLPDETAVVRRFAGYYHVPLSEDELSRLGPDEQWEYLLQQSKAANVIPPDAGLEQVRRLMHVYACNIRSQETYVPQPYANPIVFYRAAERDDGGPQDETYGWHAMADAGVAVHVIPGNHFTMLQPPNVQVLADSLNELLQQT